jgi:hypothetical protein
VPGNDRLSERIDGVWWRRRERRRRIDLMVRIVLCKSRQKYEKFKLT